MKLHIEESFALKYSLIYTSFIFLILLVPFFIYSSYMYTLEESKTKVLLQKKSIQIINQMEAYGKQNKTSFLFPRYQSFKAGLYDKNHNVIFSTINNTPLLFKKGYTNINDKRIYVVEFSNDRYFNAKYLVVSTLFDASIIFQNILIILIGIFIITFLLSLSILKHFAKPFNQINETLDQFIKDSMHEINTPLSIININIDMFSKQFGDNKYLTRVKSASKILSFIYNDMNYLIKEKSINKTSKQFMNFSSTLQNSIDYFIDIAKLKAVNLEIDIQEDIYINFVPTKLQKLIDNNLSNAIKYSYENQDVLISLKQQDDEIILSFEDKGIGISDTIKIFSRYYREDHTKGGFGIGLNIVSQILKDENIKVELTSKLKKGTTFKYIFN